MTTKICMFTVCSCHIYIHTFREPWSMCGSSLGCEVDVNAIPLTLGVMNFSTLSMWFKVYSGGWEEMVMLFGCLVECSILAEELRMNLKLPFWLKLDGSMSIFTPSVTVSFGLERATGDWLNISCFKSKLSFDLTACPLVPPILRAKGEEVKSRSAWEGGFACIRDWISAGPDLPTLAKRLLLPNCAWLGQPMFGTFTASMLSLRGSGATCAFPRQGIAGVGLLSRWASMDAERLFLETGFKPPPLRFLLPFAEWKCVVASGSNGSIKLLGDFVRAEGGGLVVGDWTLGETLTWLWCWCFCLRNKLRWKGMGSGSGADIRECGLAKFSTSGRYCCMYANPSSTVGLWMAFLGRAISCPGEWLIAICLPLGGRWCWCEDRTW